MAKSWSSGSRSQALRVMKGGVGKRSRKRIEGKMVQASRGRLSSAAPRGTAKFGTAPIYGP